MRTILIVDDEPTILRLAAMALQRRYRVLTATSGEAALEAAAAEPVDLLLTDQRMATMTGLELIEQVRAQQPGLPCLLCTGFTEEPRLREAIEERGVPVLFKPWTPTDLRRMVDTALGAGTQA
jgi:adenylate cyclase